MFKKTKGLANEFKAFIMRGNVIDMAVGVIIATAFGKITTSIVNDVFMPFIGWLIGGYDLSKLNIILQPEVLDEAGVVVTPAVTIGIGTLLVTIIDFLIIAVSVFAMIKIINKLTSLRQKEEEAAAAPEPEPAPAPEPEPTKEEILLTEIRDLLKK